MATMIGGDFFKIYGLQPMSLEEEMNAPANIKRTRGNKIAAIDTCAFMRRTLDTIESIALNIPELDDDNHSALVEMWMQAIRYAKEQLDEVLRVGR